MMAIWITTAFFAVVLCAVLLSGYFLIRREAYARQQPPSANESLLGQAFQSIGELMPAAHDARNPVRRLLVAAGYPQPHAVAAFYGVRCACAVGLAAALVMAASWRGADRGSKLIALMGGAGFGYMLPTRWLKRAAGRRRVRLRRGLPTALDLCALSLETGQALDQAILDTSRGIQRSHPDLASEMHFLCMETRASNNRAHALRNFASRTGEPEIRKIAALLNDADRFGGSIAPSLRNHARYLRVRMRQQAYEAARKVSVKLVFPIFFLIFPSVLLVTLGPACILVLTQLRAALP